MLNWNYKIMLKETIMLNYGIIKLFKKWHYTNMLIYTISMMLN